MKRLTRAVFLALLFSGACLIFRSGPDRLATREPQPPFQLTITNVPARAAHIPYGEEFWRSTKQSASRPPRFAALPFDINEVVERASHEWRRENAQSLEVTSRRFSAALNQFGLSMRLRDSDENLSATFVTKSIRRGNDSLAIQQDPFQTTANVAQREIASGIIEHIDARRDGISVTWILDRPVGGAGSLDMKVEATGLPYAGATRDGLHFADASGRGFRFGKVTAVDHGGHTWALDTVAQGGGIQISVPETVLNAAEYPLAIDPLINPEFSADAPSPTLDPNYQSPPSIAYADGVYLISWNDMDPRFGGGQTHIVRYDWRGHPMSPDPVEGLAFGESSALQITSNGSDFLVFSEQAGFAYCQVTMVTALLGYSRSFQLPESPIAVASTGGDYHAGYLAVSLVNSNGYRYIARPLHPREDAPVGPAVELMTGVVDHFSLASDGTNYLAVWAYNGIHCLRLSPDGRPIDAGPFLISGAAGLDHSPTVTYAQGYPDGAYLVSWLRGNNVDENSQFLCERVDRNATALDPTPIVVAGPANLSSAISTPHGQGFLLAWHSSDYASNIFQIQAARLPLIGPLETPFTVISQRTFHVQSLHAAPAVPVAFDTFLLWNGYHAESSADLVGRMIPQDRAMEPLQILAAGANVESSPAVAHGDNGYLVVWQDNRNALTNEDDIFGIYIDENGRLKSDRAFPIATGPADQSSPTVAASRDRYLVAWRDSIDNQASSDDVKAALLTNETVIRELTLCSETNSQRGAAVASDGTNFLAVWRDHRNGSINSDIYGMHITADGALVGPLNGFPICNETNIQAAPVIASNGTNYLVVWRDSRNNSLGARDDIYGAIIQPISAALPESIGISAVIFEDQHAPDVASNGKDYFVVWRDERNDNNVTKVEIYGTPVSASGVVGNAFGIPLVAPAPHQREPAISRFGDDYLLAWQEKNDATVIDPTPRYHTFTRRIMSDGSLDSAVTKVSATGKDEGILAIAAGGSSRALIVSQTESPIQPRIVAAQACLSNCPIILTLVVENGSPAIAWNAESNQHYRLQWSTSLATPDWHDAGDITPTDQGFTRLPDANGFTGATRFYRIVRLP